MDITLPIQTKMNFTDDNILSIVNARLKELTCGQYYDLKTEKVMVLERVSWNDYDYGELKNPSEGLVEKLKKIAQIQENFEFLLGEA